MEEEAERKRGRLGLFPQATPLIWASVADEVSELSGQHRALSSRGSRRLVRGYDKRVAGLFKKLSELSSPETLPSRSPGL